MTPMDARKYPTQIDSSWPTHTCIQKMANHVRSHDILQFKVLPAGAPSRLLVVALTRIEPSRPSTSPGPPPCGRAGHRLG